MNRQGTPPTFAPDFRAGARRAVRLDSEALVETGFVDGYGELPLLLRPRDGEVRLAAWAGEQKSRLRDQLLRYGAILFRGFALDSIEGFQEVARAVTPDLLDYQERAAPRVEVAKKVFTSTEFPADLAIALHHEMSYAHQWPSQLWLFCVQPATSGGATPIADDRRVFGAIADEIKRPFLDRRVMYVRNYGGGVDLPWQEAFQTAERAAVEEYGRRSHMQIEWLGGDRLRTRAVRQVTATHPQTGDLVWFNHAHMFHVSNLEPAVRTALQAQFAPDELPRNAFYGDGTPIPDSALEEIRRVYREAAVAVPWQAGDLLLVDNFLTSHGRQPFTGPRRIVVAMAELYDEPALAAAG